MGNSQLRGVMKLRKAKDSDIGFCAEIRSLPEVYKNCGRVKPLTKEEFLQTVTKNTQLFIMDNIGYLRFDNFGKNNSAVDIGIAIHTNYHGKGYGTTALRDGLKEMRKLGTTLFMAKVKIDNIASQKIFLKNGFIVSNTDNQYVYFSRS